MTRQRERPPWVAAAALLLLGGCAPLEPLPPEGVARGGGGSGGSGSSGPDTLVVDVVTTGFDDFLAQQPAAGAVVAFDMPGAERIEQTVGADGRVEFEGLDWAMEGSGAVTAYLPGYLPYSFVGLTAESARVLTELDGTEELTLPLMPVLPPMVVLSGIATPMIDSSDTIFVYATTRCAGLATVGAGWATRVPAATATTLVAHALRSGGASVSPRGSSGVFVQWAELEQEAVDSDTTAIQIDFGASLAATEVSGSFDVPGHGISGFFAEAKGRAGVSSADSGGTALFGTPDWIDAAADGAAFEYDMQHVTPAAVELPWTYYRLFRGTEQYEQSKLLVPGYPTAGAQAGVLPEPVQLAESTEATLGERLEWAMNPVDASDPLLRVQITIREPLGEIPRWQLTMPPGTTELILPASLPSNADLDEVLGRTTLEAFVELCEPALSPEAYRGLCRRWSRSLPVRIFRPAPWGSPEGSPESP